jgi:hypothetical protein
MRRTLLAPPTDGRAVSSRRLARLLVPVAVVGATLAMSACETQSPVQTEASYNPADGVPVDLGAVQLRDLVIISSGKGKPGVLVASMINTGSGEQRVMFQSGGSATPVFATAPGNSVEQLSSKSPVQLPSVPVSPGDTLQMTVQTPTAPAVAVVVPVLSPHGYYATITPSENSGASSSTTTSH